MNRINQIQIPKEVTKVIRALYKRLRGIAVKAKNEVR